MATAYPLLWLLLESVPSLADSTIGGASRAVDLAVRPLTWRALGLGMPDGSSQLACCDFEWSRSVQV